MHTMDRLLLALVALTAAPAAAIANTPNAIPGAYFVELHETADVSEFANKVQAGVSARIRRQIDYEPSEAKAGAPYKAVSIDLEDTSKINEVAAMPDVVKVHSVTRLSLGDVSPEGLRKGRKQNPLDKTGETGQRLKVRRGLHETNLTTDEYTPHVMMQIDKLRNKGITGKGIKIGMIDTGIDYEHPALGGCFGPGCLVSFGKDLVNGEPTPKDLLGHGTKCAGIIAAQTNPMGFTGAAPNVQLGMYRITLDGNFATDIMVDAIFLALKEGVDIISSSAGLPGGWPDSILSIAASRAVDSGVIFVQGAGNNAHLGIFSSIDPAVGNGVISVGNMNNDVAVEIAVEAKYTVDNDSEVTFAFFPSITAQSFTGTPMEVYAPSLHASNATGKDIHACTPIADDAPDLSDKLVLLRFEPGKTGDCALSTRIKSVLAKNATWILLYRSPEDGNPSFWHIRSVEGITGVGALEFKTATSMLKALQAGRKVLVTAFPDDEKAPRVYVEMPNNDEAGSVSHSSSWGPSWNLGLKPSLAAVGEQVITTTSRNDDPSGYTITQGTSFSGPLIAGIVALILEARGSKKLSPAAIESLLVSHSYPQLYHDGDRFESYLAPVAQQGGGLARAYDAAYSTTLLTPAGLSFNDTEHMAASLNLTLTNIGETDVTYHLSHVPAITVYAFTENSTISAWPGKIDPVEVPAAISLSDTSLTIAAGKSGTIKVSASLPGGLDASRLPILSGWIAVNGSDGSSLSVPYQGFGGSIRKHQVLPPDGAALIHGNVSVSKTPAVKLPAQGAIDTSQLMLNINTTLGSSLVHADVIPLKSVNCTGNATSVAAKSIGQIQGFPVRWRPNILTYGQEHDLLQFIQFRWNGQLDSGKFAPEGSYKLAVRALRIFGNPDNHEDWDVSETPRFDITYDQQHV